MILYFSSIFKQVEYSKRLFNLQFKTNESFSAYWKQKLKLIQKQFSSLKIFMLV